MTAVDLLERVAERARTKDPGLPTGTARALAREALQHARERLQAARDGSGEDGGELQAPQLARHLLRARPDAGATAANVVAVAVLELLDEQAAAG